MQGTDGGTVARAFELAREGTCQTIEDIRRQLEREKYEAIGAHLTGLSIRRQLSEIMKVRSQS